MLNKSQLKKIFSEFSFKPMRRRGQNFLIDRNIRDKIISQVACASQDTILEIGPGSGVLTEELCRLAKRVVAVELDQRLCKILTRLLRGCANLELVGGNILELDLNRIFKQEREIKLVSNLPYYMASPIIFWILANRQIIKEATLTLQKELAWRILASPGSKDYSVLTCLVGFNAEAQPLFAISRKAFWPEPEVDSYLLRLKMRDKPCVSVKDEGLFFKIIKAAFSQRRKKIVNALSEGGLNKDKKQMWEILEACGIAPERRPQTLSLEEFAMLANLLARRP
jgi:16S rRNA (adenine1518-N6/adenine1519-N6)-dimethyltransferase